ncbi:prefoldin subunit beta [Candidatus Pacearchaeota archaeon]|nr:prefoldin subunit beta [Candidatus Pacearchaeota archaeon]
MDSDKINEMQVLEQTLHNLILQKQNFQMELSETQSALAEMEKSGDDVFKIVGQLMIKADKDKIKEELSGREKILELRLKSLERQEDSFMKKLDGLKEEVVDSQNN